MGNMIHHLRDQPERHLSSWIITRELIYPAYSCQYIVKPLRIRGPKAWIIRSSLFLFPCGTFILPFFQRSQTTSGGIFVICNQLWCTTWLMHLTKIPPLGDDAGGTIWYTANTCSSGRRRSFEWHVLVWNRTFTKLCQIGVCLDI